jgi:hypothetical protein
MLASGVCRGVDEVELPRTDRDGHRRAVRMISGSVMSGPTPRA